jgi:hypothetical protein
VRIVTISNIDLTLAEKEIKHFGTKIQKIQNCSIMLAEHDETQSAKLKMIYDQIKRGFLVIQSRLTITERKIRSLTAKTIFITGSVTAT